jgi:hypothetical protein
MLLFRTVAKNRRAEPLQRPVVWINRTGPPASADSYCDAKPMRAPASERCDPRRSLGGERHKTSKDTIERWPSQTSLPTHREPLFLRPNTIATAADLLTSMKLFLAILLAASSSLLLPVGAADHSISRP